MCAMPYAFAFTFVRNMQIDEIAYQIPHFSKLWISWYSITFDPVKNFLLFCPFYLTG